MLIKNPVKATIVPMEPQYIISAPVHTQYMISVQSQYTIAVAVHIIAPVQSMTILLPLSTVTPLHLLSELMNCFHDPFYR